MGGEAPGAADAEPFDEFGARVQEFVTDVLARHADETVLIVAHGGSGRVVQALAQELDYVRDHRLIRAMANCEVARYAARDGKLAPID